LKEFRDKSDPTRDFHFASELFVVYTIASIAAKFWQRIAGSLTGPP
jgi:hypothetical protein